MKFVKDIQKVGGLSLAGLYMLLLLLSGTFHQHESNAVPQDLPSSHQTKIQHLKHASFQDCFVCHFNSTFQIISSDHFQWDFQISPSTSETIAYATVSTLFQEKRSVFLRGPPELRTI